MIKAIITDVDGVVVGTKTAGYFPYPSPKVIEAIKTVNRKVPVILCSGKPSFGLFEVIKILGLNNLHIATNGAVIFNPFKDEYMADNIPTNTVQAILEKLLEADLNADIVGEKAFYHPKDKLTPFVQKLAKARFCEPVLVDDIKFTATLRPVLRVDVFVDKKEKTRVEKIVKSISDQIEINWTGVQFDPTQIGLITLKGISKATAFEKVAKNLNMDKEEFLGLGDGLNDWSFMKECGQVGVVGNAEAELVNAVRKFKGISYTGSHVDQNGIIDILKHYQLL